MMTNLFSTFDPSTGMMSLNWLSCIIPLIMINYNYWTTFNNIKMLMFMIMINLHNELKSILKLKGSTIMLISMFLIILINNLMGLLPYVFTSSSHLCFSLSIALPMWMTLMMYGWLMKTNKMFSHLVPIGTPTPLMPFMIIIETISNMIRPGSLAVRLSANMIAGHLLMSLLGNSTSLISMLILMVIFILLMLFELAVAIIQSYVFMTLSSLYSSEI